MRFFRVAFVAGLSIWAGITLAVAVVLARVNHTQKNMPTDRYFEVQQLAPGVYGVIRKEPPGLAVDCNVVFIVNEKDVVMVDANIGPESASATLSALRKITSKPVSAIVITHYHDDHIGGLETFLKAFPKAKVIGHESVARAVKKYGEPSRKEMIQVAPEMTQMLRGCLAKNKGLSGKDITEEEKQSYLSDIRIADRYAKEMPKVKTILPSVKVNDRLVLTRGSRKIEIMQVGTGHTISDLVVNLPKEGIVVTGDLVVWPVPLVGNPQSTIAQWPQALANLRSLKARTLVPGHGKVMHDDAYLKLLEVFFQEVTRQVNAGVGKGETLEEIQKEIQLGEFEKSFVGGSPVRRVLYLNYVKMPSIAAAYREALAKR